MGSLITAFPEYEEKELNFIDGILTPIYEEESVVWLWARPEIFSWPNPIAWLLSPVNQRTTWTGDLWGIDSEGELVIIEGKFTMNSDPFMDYIKMRKKTGSEFYFSSNAIKERWSKYFHSELLDGKKGFEEREPGKTPGILPRSSKRVCLRYWKHLTKNIDINIRAEEYTNTVKANLKLRESRGNPPPHFVGLLVAGKQKILPNLSTKGKRSKKALEKSVGEDHVHLYIAKANKISTAHLNISVDKVE